MQSLRDEPTTGFDPKTIIANVSSRAGKSFDRQIEGDWIRRCNMTECHWSPTSPLGNRGKPITEGQ